MKRLAILLCFAFACDTKPMPDDDFSFADGKEDSFSKKTTELGKMRFGDTVNAAYSNPPLYRGFSFDGAIGDVADIWVRSTDGDAVAWLLDGKYKILAKNDDADSSTTDSHLHVTLASNDTFHIVFREYGKAAAHFQVTLASATPASSAPANHNFTSATRVFAGNTHSCALQTDGMHLYCWGTGPLGVPANTQVSPPPPPNNLATFPFLCIDSSCGKGGPHATVLSASVGGGRTCILNSWGEVICTDNIYQPMASFQARGGVRLLSPTFGSHTCVDMIHSEETYHCWGNNTYNQLGGKPYDIVHDPYIPGAIDGMTGSSTDFLPVYGEIVAGGRHTCAREYNGFYTDCWGANDHSQLGHAPSTAGNEVTGLDQNDHGLSAGLNHTCVIHDPDGSVRCWGANDHGQLGDGTTTDRIAPVTVSGVSGAKKVAAGGTHSCALIGTSVKCWGGNDSGQLGGGDVTLAGPAVDVSAGTNHSCAVLSDGRVECWGENRYGQLGDGSFTDRATPVLVQKRQ